MRIRGFIFDFNGVIVNDEPLHCSAVRAALESANLHMSVGEYYEKYLPFDDYNLIVRFLADRGVAKEESEVRGLTKLKAQNYLKLVSENPPINQGSVGFILGLPTEFPIVIASGAARSEIDLLLGKIGLRNRFREVVAAGDVTNSKPHPEAFLKAYRALGSDVPGLLPDQVVVFEDSPRGIAAAKSAGMRCVGLTTSYPGEKLVEADLVLGNLHGWTLEKIESAVCP